MHKEFFNTKNQKTGLYMINCGYEDCIDHFIANPHIRKYYLIHYVTKGSGYYEVKNQKYFVKEGDIFIIYPYELISYYSPDPANTWSFCWIGFSGADAPQYAALAGMTDYTRTVKNQDFYISVKQCLDYIIEMEQKRTVISQFRLTSTIMTCLFAISDKNHPRVERSTEYVDRAIRYIEYNYMNGITTKDVAAHLSLDRTYFYRIFKEWQGTSPEQYIVEYRVKKAKELLCFSQYSISEIATFVGVRDVYYFSKMFKRIAHITPTKYRNEKKEKNEQS